MTETTDTPAAEPRPKPTRAEIWAKKFRIARANSGLSQRALARAMDVGLRGVQRIEESGFIPDDEALSHAWVALGVDLSRFVPPRPEGPDGRRRPGRPPGRTPAVPAVDPDSIAGRLRSRRKDCGLSQEELAARVVPPMPQASISKIEGGGWHPTGEIVRRLAAALECPPSRIDPELLPDEQLITLVRTTGRKWMPRDEDDSRSLARLGQDDPIPAGQLGTIANKAADEGLAIICRGDLPDRKENPID